MSVNFHHQQDHHQDHGAAVEAMMAGVLDAQGHEKPREPAEIQRRQHGAGHVVDRILRLAA